MVDMRAAAPDSGLYEIGRRPALPLYLREAWSRRAFAFRLAGYRLVGGLLQNRLGVLWLVLKPLMLAVMYGSVFYFVLSGSARPDDFVPYLLVGVFVFEYFSGCFGSGSKAVTSNAKLVQSLGFPRILLPVAVITEQAFRMIPVIALLWVLLLILGQPVSWGWLLLIPVLLLMSLFNLGVALIVARLSVHARDVQQVIPIINRVLFYASGVFFSVEGALAGFPALLTVVQLVPTYEFIALARDVLLESAQAPLLVWVAAPVWAVATLVVGVLFFWRAEARYGLDA